MTTVHVHLEILYLFNSLKFIVVHVVLSDEEMYRPSVSLELQMGQKGMMYND